MFQNTKSEAAGSKFRHSNLYEGSSEMSLGSTGCGGDHSQKLGPWSSRESARRGRNEEQGTKHSRKKLKIKENVNKHLDGVKEASSGTDEDKGPGFIKDKIDTNFAGTKSARSSFKSLRKKNKELLLDKKGRYFFLR